MERSSFTKPKAKASRSSSRTETWASDSSSFCRLESFAGTIAVFCMTREAAGYRGSPLTKSMIRRLRRQTCTPFCGLWGVEKAVHVGHSFGGPIALQYYFDHPNEVAGLVFIGSYSAGRQLAITEEQVLSLYDTIQGRHAVFETFITHEKFARFNPYAAEIEAMLQREACKPPIYASK